MSDMSEMSDTSELSSMSSVPPLSPDILQVNSNTGDGFFDSDVYQNDTWAQFSDDFENFDLGRVSK